MECLTKNGTQKCLCRSNRFWNGSSCEERLTYNDNCINPNYPSDACNSMIGLSCVITTCQCNSTSAWNGHKCSKINSFGENCTISSNCESTQGLISSSKCKRSSLSCTGQL
jgi:hypothetical protein